MKRKYPFPPVAQNRRLSVSDMFSPTGNTLFGLLYGHSDDTGERQTLVTGHLWAFLACDYQTKERNK